jgi:hypothetical protein
VLHSLSAGTDPKASLVAGGLSFLVPPPRRRSLDCFTSFFFVFPRCREEFLLTPLSLLSHKLAIVRGFPPQAPPRTMARVYADVNEHMPRSYWDYDSVNISWGVLENYEVVRKIGNPSSVVNLVL